MLEKECRVATERMGLRPSDVEIWDFKVRRFPAARQEILERFVKLNREYRPKLVLMPSTADRHQDHATISEEGFRAFKHATLFGYEVPQNNIDFRPTAFVGLSEEHLVKKIHVLSSYYSQTFRQYGTADFTRSLATVRGVQANTGLAEAYEAIRVIV